MGYIYANLRPENIMIQFDEQKRKIINVKFINFGPTTRLEDAGDMLIPEQVDHFPPELLQHFQGCRRFCQDAPDQQSSVADGNANIQFMRSCATFDVFSIGAILLQIICGYPS